MVLSFYWYPKCGTCKKAKKWLDDNDVPYTSIHIVDETPAKEVILDLIGKSGLPDKKFFNIKVKKYREHYIKDKIKNASKMEIAEFLASDGMLIKLSIATNGTNVLVGFNEDIYKEMKLK